MLAIEIQSAAKAQRKWLKNSNLFFDFGVKSCWIVIPTLQAILVYDSQTHYGFYRENEILKDKTLNVEIYLNKVFE